MRYDVMRRKGEKKIAFYFFKCFLSTWLYILFWCRCTLFVSVFTPACLPTIRFLIFHVLTYSDIMYEYHLSNQQTIIHINQKRAKKDHLQILKHSMGVSS